MVGRPIVDMYGHRDNTIPCGPTRFEAQHISRAGNFSNISFSIKGGEIVGFAGLVGAGRTEVGRSIFGAEPIEEGTLKLDNKLIHTKNPRQAIAEGIGYLSEDRKTQGLFLDFSLRTNVVANHLFDFCNSNGFIQERKTFSWASKIVSDYRIAIPDIERSVKNLSGGNQQKVLAAEWIGINPKLLIVDEPTRGVDVGAKSEIYLLIRKLAATGAGIMLISSDLSEILGLSDRIIVMQNGVIVGELLSSEATEEKVIALATGAKQGVCEL
jgi:ABC-type sugar transport system ATPase subunit